MSRVSVSVYAGAGKSAAARQGKLASAPARASSAELPEHVSKPAKSLQGARHVAAIATRRPADSSRPISRLELLLAQPRRPQPRFKPVGESATSRAINEALKRAPQWTDVQRCIAEATELSVSNLAYALNRLGCIMSFSSRLRRQELAQSDLVAQLLGRVRTQLHELDGSTVTLLLDGCARLGHAPPPEMLDCLANCVWVAAPSLEATQLPLVLWAFQHLGYTPRASVLAALEAAAARLAGTLLPQGLTLCLAGFKAAGYRPSAATLDALAARMAASLHLFKPSEVAACLAAFAAAKYQPQPSLLQALAARSGSSVHANTVSGKRPLGAPTVACKPSTVQGLLEQPAAALERGLAAASQMFQGTTLEPQVRLAGPEL